MEHSVADVQAAQAQDRQPVTRAAPPVVDMALNHGTYCARGCADVLKRYASTTGLRAYPPADNLDLRAAIAASARVDPQSVLVANGSGPLLKLCIPFLIERQIRRSLQRMARYALGRVAYPIVTPWLTYSKVPAGALRLGLRCELLPLRPEDGFALDLDDLWSRLRRRDGLVYLSNPNNPTGNLLITRGKLQPLLERFPDSFFFIDEAYVHYLPEHPDWVLADMVPRYPNLVVLRSFSFAYGLAGARVGYAVADPRLVAEFEAKLTPHRVGQLAADLAKVSLADPAHLGTVRRETTRERELLIRAIRGYPDLEAFDSLTNFVLCRARGHWTGVRIRDELLARGVAVKTFEPFGGYRFDEFFRVTVGLPAENVLFLRQLDAVLGPRRGVPEA